jgi:hypothetical protein
MDGGTCSQGANGFADDDAGMEVACGGGGVCLDDTSLDGGWYRFTGIHNQLYPNTDQSLTAFHCGTEEPGWLEAPVGPTPIGVETAGNVCFDDSLNKCDWSAPIVILNCGPDAGIVYQLSNFTGVCSLPIQNLGAYCTQ